MAKRLINQNTDGSKETYAGALTSAGAGSSGELPALDATGKLDPTFMPVGFGQDSVTATAAEALTAGDFVYFSGASAVSKADATSLAKQAKGYVNANVANAATATVFFDDSNTGKTGLTVNVPYYLSLTPGGITTTAPNAATQIVQRVGFANSTTNLRADIEEAVLIIA
jgi:hypothetical protein